MKNVFLTEGSRSIKEENGTQYATETGQKFMLMWRAGTLVSQKQSGIWVSEKIQIKMETNQTYTTHVKDMRNICWNAEATRSLEIQAVVE